MKKIVCLLSFIIIPFCILAQRVSYSLNDSWLFFKGQANVMTPTDNWQEVTLPHSWNMEDGQYSGKNRLDDNGHAQIQRGDTVSIVDPAIKFGYYRGVGWYARIINIPLNPQLHSRSATYIKRNGLLIRKITIKSSRPFQCAYHPLTP